jgi:probable F420-dependent oxidoreductase
MELTRFGVWTSYNAIGEENAQAAAKVAEQLGYGTFWLGGSPRLASLAPLLSGSAHITVATSIVNVWQYDPVALCEEFHALDGDFPGRLLVGIGIGHPEATSEYQKPLAKMRAFLEAIAAAPRPIPSDRLIVAALGPRMLELSGERTLGTIPYFVPPAHTAFARAQLGPGKLVAPELAVVVDADAERAQATARRYAQLYLGLTNYTANLERFGFTAADITDGGSSRLIDTVVPQGSAAALVPHIQAHLDAGADHVCVQTLGVPGVPEAAWRAVAEALALPPG